MSENDSNQRQQALVDWALKQLNELGLTHEDELKVYPASDDASFRRYFRAMAGTRSYILMDAPPRLENSLPFVQVGHLLFDHEINVPQIHAVDLELGFMLLTDFGSVVYLDELRNARGKAGVRESQLYDDALKALLQIQKIEVSGILPPYDRDRLLAEMNLFREWFLPQLLRLEISDSESGLLDKTFDNLIENALCQPQVLVHRDYHSRNLMVLSAESADRNPGILDFQDAVKGPVTYDLVSLLRDCYISWPDDYVYGLVQNYKNKLVNTGLIEEVDDSEFERWFDLMGMQRHIKVAGIFSRLKLRDGKDRYLKDIPLVVRYILMVADKYEEFGEFSGWLNSIVVDRMKMMDISTE